MNQCQTHNNDVMITTPSIIKNINSKYLDGSIETIDDDESLTLRTGALSGLTSLRSLTMREVLTISEAGVFKDLTALEAVSFPKLTSISSEDAFSGCSSLATVSMPSVSSISGGAWSYTQTADIQRDSGFFRNCPLLTTISLPSLVSLGACVFWGCSGLANVDLPEVTNVGVAAFGSCNALTALVLPKVTTLGQRVFRSCNGLLQIQLGSLGHPVTSTNNSMLKQLQSNCTVTIYVSDPSNVTLSGAGSNYGADSNVTVTYAQA